MADAIEIAATILAVGFAIGCYYIGQGLSNVNVSADCNCCDDYDDEEDDF